MESFIYMPRPSIDSSSRADILDKLRSNLNKDDLKKLSEFSQELENGIEGIEEAKEYITEMRKLTPPIITIPNIHLAEIEKSGYINSHPSWTGHKILAATLNRKPYNDADRTCFAILPHVPVEPRFTGKPGKDGESLFRGVVIISDRHGNKLDLSRDLQRIN